jgi:DNA-binding GntR family transcriptional regulator
VASKNFENRLNPETADRLGDDAYKWLIDAITSFRIPTNSQISENKLAAELGVSRTPIREALKRLETQGLVKRGEDGRFIVAMLTPKDVDEALDLLLMCDTYLFQRAAKNIDDTSAQVLKESAEMMSTCAAKSDREGWMKYDKTFHEIIMRAADNEMVAEVSRVTRRRIKHFWAYSVSGAVDLVSCSHEHTEIVQAMIAKDMTGIKKSVGGHLGHLRVNMHEIVQSMAPFFGSHA